jgi:hypothetical protein
MARPRTPTAVLKLRGAFKKDPKRAAARQNEPVPTGPLGEPPTRFDKYEKAAWSELAAIAPPGVLSNSHRWLVELACRLKARMDQHGVGGNFGLSVGEQAQFKDCLIRMGLTPADSSKVSVPKAPETSSVFAVMAKDTSAGTRPN